LLGMKPIDNCVIAFSLSPVSVARAIEHKAPNLGRRIHAMQQLQKHGWQVGLRFDPLIYQTGFERDYRELFANVFSSLDPGLIHSVSLGSFRLPKPFFRKISALYPDEKLFAAALDESQDMVSYEETIRHHLLSFCRDEILSYLPEQKFFPCEPLPS
ncbi:MAG: spore photoproduct lyase family protein, partial [Balneolales bacterium]